MTIGSHQTTVGRSQVTLRRGGSLSELGRSISIRVPRRRVLGTARGSITPRSTMEFEATDTTCVDKAWRRAQQQGWTSTSDDVES
jgi:hypothetical protein